MGLHAGFTNLKATNMSNTATNLEAPAAAPLLSHERLLELLAYDPLTGKFSWNATRGKRFKAGDTAGSINAKGYVAMTVDGHRHFGHRLAWFYCFGKWPEGNLQIDHINGIKDDNRISNLRLVTPSQNKQNTHGPRRDNASGFTGVKFNKSCGKYEANIRIPGERNKKYLGIYPTPEEASRAYLSAKAVYHHQAFARC